MTAQTFKGFAKKETAEMATRERGKGERDRVSRREEEGSRESLAAGKTFQLASQGTRPV